MCLGIHISAACQETSINWINVLQHVTFTVLVGLSLYVLYKLVTQGIDSLWSYSAYKNKREITPNKMTSGPLFADRCFFVSKLNITLKTAMTLLLLLIGLYFVWPY